MFALQDRRSRPAALVALGIIALITIIYIQPVYEAIGETNVLWFYDLSVIVLAGFSAVLSLLLARSYGKGEVLRRIWFLLGLGLGMWTLGEALWAYYELILQVDPYPSPADIVWVLGYIPLFSALYLRFRSLATTPEPQRAIPVAILFLVILVLASIFVFVPIIQDLTTPVEPSEEIEEEPEVASDPFTEFLSNPTLEAAITILYPVGDLIVALGALLIFLVLTGGALSRPWVMIAAGFVILAIADLFFTYAEWFELYHVDEGINLVSALVDVPYYAGYVIIGFGVYLQARLQKIL